MSSKGSSFEREISKFLSVWLTGNEKPYQYWRMPGSGSLCTIHEENINLSGDIRSLTAKAEFLTDIFSIELKNGYPSTSFWQHFSESKCFNLRDFWYQASRDAEKANKKPMLIYRKKGKKPLIGIDDEMHDILSVYNYHLTLLNNIRMNFGKNHSDLLPLVLMDFYSFFDIMKPDMIKKLKSED
jgi:hypothetical protein